jgi:hypothetical protein
MAAGGRIIKCAAAHLGKLYPEYWKEDYDGNKRQSWLSEYADHMARSQSDGQAYQYYQWFLQQFVVLGI